MPKMRLTEVAIRKLKRPQSGRIDYFDELVPGFGVRHSHTDRKVFFGFQWVNGEQRRETFQPPWPALSLKDARANFRSLVETVDAGKDPKLERQRKRREAKRETATSYAVAVEDFIQKEIIGRRGNSTWKETRRLLLKHGADWHGLPLSMIGTADVFDVLDRLVAAGKGTLANRTYSAFRLAFAWWRARDLIASNPMDRVAKPFDGEKRRTRIYTDQELKALWRAADKMEVHRGAFLKLLLLTGKRKTALAAMRRDEVDEDGLWTPPQPTRRRRGNKRNHARPLPGLAQRILKGLPDTGAWVFPGRTGGHMDPGTSLKDDIVQDSGVVDFTYHATRHTVETRLAELGIFPHIRDLCLDHAPLRGAGAGYDHYEYVDEIREAFEIWADTLERLVTPQGARRLR